MTSPKQRKPRKRKVVDDMPLHPWLKDNLIEWPVDATPQQLDKILAPGWQKTFNEMMATVRYRAAMRAAAKQDGAA